MIECLLFDFGDIWIDLQHREFDVACKQIGLVEFPNNWSTVNEKFETGMISSDAFIASLMTQTAASKHQVISVWNALIAPVPAYRMDFLQRIKKKYRLFLLSNTDAIHIAYFSKLMGEAAAIDFFSSFEHLYFSFEMGYRKPDPHYFEYVFHNSKLNPETCFFIDDRADNIAAAAAAGLRGWHLKPEQDDVVDLEQQIARLI
jgi:HAD superfamily hydrolase (TIGR01549 family)